MVAGVLLVLATAVHPSKETPAAILEQELRLIAGHWLYTFFHGFSCSASSAGTQLSLSGLGDWAW